ncbi:MAG: hypothetical protein BIFFINMI_03588 [Phycisphaerae bacterium]|nr:hypothetical protein [Phycisphaerae bacterium]
MSLGTVQFGPATVSRLIIGGNPFSGFSHISRDKNLEMQRWYTVERIKAALRSAEAAGVTTHLSRVDDHVRRYLMEYSDQGGRIGWIAQTCPGVGTTERCVSLAVGSGAIACFIHGGVMDYAVANGQTADIGPAVERIRAAGLAAGVACHNPIVLDWAEAHLDVDFYMCCYYNPTDRTRRAEFKYDIEEVFDPADRDRMVARIASLSKPAIHYKVMAAGRNDPADAMAFTADHLRDGDAVCVGIYTRDGTDMIAQDARLLESALRARGKLTPAAGL